MMRPVLSLALLFGGCRDPLPNPVDMAGDAAQPNDPTRCSPMNVSAVADEGNAHVAAGTPVIYRHQPPASGPHWSSPPPLQAPHAWGVYLDESIPDEEWVHNLEHGGIVFLFSCPGVVGWNYDLGASPDGGAAMPCPDVTSVLVQVANEKSTGTLVTGYAMPTKRVTAVAWDWIYQSNDVNATELRCFRDARWGNGPEKFF